MLRRESLLPERTAVRLELEAVEQQLTQQAEELTAINVKAAAMGLTDGSPGC